jgi:hypothetical protein
VCGLTWLIIISAHDSGPHLARFDQACHAPTWAYGPQAALAQSDGNATIHHRWTVVIARAQNKTASPVQTLVHSSPQPPIFPEWRVSKWPAGETAAIKQSWRWSQWCRPSWPHRWRVHGSLIHARSLMCLAKAVLGFHQVLAAMPWWHD